MAKRVITFISIDLRFNVLTDPPAAEVVFADVDDAGREKFGKVFLADARTLVDVPAFLATINVAIDVKAAEVNDPVAITDRITEAARLDAEIEKRKAELAALEQQLRWSLPPEHAPLGTGIVSG